MEFGAALAELMFIVFWSLRTKMEILQLNVFVAWCTDAMKCGRALSGVDRDGSENDSYSTAEGAKRFFGFLHSEQ